MVVIYHIHPRIERMGYDGLWPEWGRGGVDLFFVISGFIMWVTTAGRDVTPQRFYSKRIKRIVPIYWIVTSIAALLGATTVWHITASYLFLPAVHPREGEVWPILIVGWTLNYEMLFYAVFGASLLLPERYRLWSLATFFVALVVAGRMVNAAQEIEFWLDGILLEFVAGLLIGKLWLAGRMISLGWPGVVVGFALFPILDSFEVPRFVALGIPASIIVLGALSLEPVGNYPIPRLIGDASYSLYLVHGFALVLGAKLWLMLGLHWMAFIPVALCAAAGAGIAFYLAVERPISALLGSGRRSKAAKV